MLAAPGIGAEATTSGRHAHAARPFPSLLPRWASPARRGGACAALPSAPGIGAAEATTSGRHANAPRAFPCRAPPARRGGPCHAMDPGPDPEDPISRLNFVYMNPAAAAAADAARAAAREASLREYEDLKALLLKRTWRFGTLFAGYLLFTVSAESAAAELVGAAASYGYLLWLCRDVDAYGPDTPVPARAADAVEPALARNVARVGAAYRMALNPRLLVPAGLLGACAAWNAAFPDFPLGVVEQGCVLGGFLSYKVALILKIYDDLKPRPLTEEEMAAMARPQLAELEDVELKLKRPSEIAAEAAEAEAGAGAAEEQQEQRQA